MNMSGKDYSRLYQLQDKFLSWWFILGYPFYLTGGTALGRFYLNHRYSDDLDFFTNANAQYPGLIKELNRKIKGQFSVNLQQSLFTEDFSRLFITKDDLVLKIEFVNDIEYYAGKPAAYKYGFIDTPLNILSNKLTALVGREEPKDIFDIIHISARYSFNWMDIFYHSKQKAFINELDVEQRLSSFPVEWLENVNWLSQPVNLKEYKSALNTIADDFLLGKDNSLGINQPPLESAKPIL